MSEPRRLAEKFTEPALEAGQALWFLFRMLAGLRFTPSQILSVLQQVYLVGARSLVIIMICGFFVGMVLSLRMPLGSDGRSRAYVNEVEALAAREPLLARDRRLALRATLSALHQELLHARDRFFHRRFYRPAQDFRSR